jgi:proline dehydrogenase
MEASGRAAAALRWLARRQDIKRALLASPELSAVLKAAAARYVAGSSRAEALDRAARLARAGHRVTIDFMGEDTSGVSEARRATAEFLALVADLGPADSTPEGPLVAASISLDLSHIGLAVPGLGERLAREHLNEVAERARAVGREVMISMEGSERTEAILRTHAVVSDRYENVGVTVQAALRRTPSDFPELLARPGRLRLVKGAYADSPRVAHPRGEALDEAYLSLARQLVDAAARHGRRCSIATHDAALVDRITNLIDEVADLDGATNAIEFEMLQGVTPDRLDSLLGRGYVTRVYLVYGSEVYLYLCHRLAEHPPAILDVLADATEGWRELEGDPG